MNKVGLKKVIFLGLALVGLGACTKKSGGPTESVVRLPMVADAKTFDPALCEDYYTAQAVSNVYETLLEYEYLVRPHKLKPLLASAMPNVSADGLVYTFKILPSVKFADSSVFPGGKGREVKASDFVYSFLRVADPKVNSPGYWIFDGHIKGLDEWRAAQKSAPATRYDVPVAGLQAVDDFTLKITLNRKYPQLLFVLAMPYASVVPREAVEQLGPDFASKPVGTGPFLLSNWMRNSKITFVKNPGFRGQTYPTDGSEQDRANGLLSDAGKAMPFAEKLELNVYVESQPGWLNFSSGSLELTRIPKDNFKSAIDVATGDLLPDLKNKGIRLFKEAELDVTYYAFNMEDPVIKKGGANLRKAIALAIDKRKSIEIFRNGRAVLAHGMLPPGVAGADETFKNPYSEYDVAKAKDYLAKAGFPEGKGLPELVFESTQGSDTRQKAEKLQKELAAIGIKLRVNTNQFSELTEKINNRKAQMWGLAWLADYPDAENFLQLLYAKNAAPGPNGSNFDHAEYNRLYEQVRSMTDSPARRKMIRKMLEIFAQETPWVVEDHRVNYELIQPWLKNYKMGYMGASVAKFLRVERTER